MKSNKFYILLIFSFLILTYPILSDIILNEVMYNPIGSEHHTEFVEIYNNGDESVNLDGYKISDGNEIDALVLYPSLDSMILKGNSYCIIMDSSYPSSSTYYEGMIPDSVLRVVIEDGSFGSYGFNNTIAETLFIYDGNDLIIDIYTYSIDQEPGFSDERIYNSAGSINNEWGNSLGVDGSPGFKNSISPWDYDLSLNIAESSIPTSVELGEEVLLDFTVKNIGLNDIEGFLYTILLDDLIIVSYEFQGAIGNNDSISFSESIIIGSGSGSKDLKFILENEEDEYLLNNLFETEIFVNYSAEDIITINEFKKNPVDGECEWLEIVNISGEPILISDFCFSDNNYNSYDDLISISANYELQPDSFFIIAKDSSIFSFYDFTNISSEKVEINSLFPTLNNSEDKIFLYTRSGSVVDSIYYTEDSWFEDDNGRSLEKINSSLSSGNADNWNISVDLGTPGKENSIFQDLNGSNNQNGDKKNFIEILNKGISPDGDGMKDNLVVNYSFESSFIYLTANVFNIKGQKVAEISNNYYSRGVGTLIWNTNDFKNYNIPIGAYIFYFKVKNDRGELFYFKEPFYIVK